MYRLGFMGTKDLHGFIFVWGDRRVNLLWPFGDNDWVTKGAGEKPPWPGFLGVYQVSEESL